MLVERQSICRIAKQNRKTAAPRACMEEGVRCCAGPVENRVTRAAGSGENDWWRGWDSNPRPEAYESSALPTELPRHYLRR